MHHHYQLLDSGNGRKLERFGPFVLNRPCPQAIWRPRADWEADAIFHREEETKWTFLRTLPESWQVCVEGIAMKIAPTDFGHVGLFAEHAGLWKWMCDRVRPGSSILNLFAYSGGATLALAKAGASVCHLDASKGMVQWARGNSLLNGLADAPIRWIVDDALKFLHRERKRGVRYDGILLDPPTFGRGAQGEVFKIERDLPELLELCKALLSERPLFLVLSCHSPGFTPIGLSHCLKQLFKKSPEVFEMEILAKEGFSIPSGCAARIDYAE